MKTPYDTAVRIQRRTVDETRIAISLEVTRLREVEQARDLVQTRMARETEAAAAEPMISTAAYLARMRKQRASLDAARETTRRSVDRLRDQAAAAYGSLRAMESAADEYRHEAGRAAAAAEQAGIDDLAGAAFIRAAAQRKRTLSS